MLTLQQKKRVPNVITMSRMILVVALIIFGAFIITRNMISEISISFSNLNQNPDMIVWVTFFVVFFVAAVTDFLDGYYARKWNAVSWFGKVTDSIADKMLVLTSIVFLASIGAIYFWLVALLLLREIIILTMRLSLKNGKSIVQAKWHGKVKTVLQFVGIIFAGLFFPIAKDYILKDDSDALIVVATSSILILSLIVSYFSLFEYVREIMKFQRQKKLK